MLPNLGQEWYLDKEGVIPKYNLQYLRYYLKLNIDATTHTAIGDVLIIGVDTVVSGDVRYCSVVHIEHEGARAMGKYVGYVILILIVLFAVEYFGIIDIPYFDIPDYFSGKEDMMDKTEKAMKQLKWFGGVDFQFKW